MQFLQDSGRIPEATDGEAETLEDICDLEAGSCRLACMAKVRGAVVVEIL